MLSHCVCVCGVDTHTNSHDWVEAKRKSPCLHCFMFRVMHHRWCIPHPSSNCCDIFSISLFRYALVFFLYRFAKVMTEAFKTRMRRGLTLFICDIKEPLLIIQLNYYLTNSLMLHLVCSEKKPSKQPQHTPSPSHAFAFAIYFGSFVTWVDFLNWSSRQPR